MQTSQHYVNDGTEQINASKIKSKKKLRFFSKSKKTNSKTTNYPTYEQQCNCEDCMRTGLQNDYSFSNQQMVQQYHPREDQMQRTHALSSSEQMYRDESHYMADRIYPPPQQYPCECTNCCKKRGTKLTTELLPLDTQLPLQMMSADSALLCNIL